MEPIHNKPSREHQPLLKHHCVLSEAAAHGLWGRALRQKPVWLSECATYAPELGVVGELVWLFCTAAATACAAVTAVFAA